MEEEEEIRKEEPEENRVFRQLKKIQTDISIWGLIMSSYEHRHSSFRTLGKTKVPIDITPKALVNLIIASKVPKPTIAFTDSDLPPKGLAHNRPLYISLKCLTKWIPLVLEDNGSPLNMCPRRTLNKLGINAAEIRPSNQGVRDVEFHGMDIPATFNLLLGRPWLHDTGEIPSTLHQKVKFAYMGGSWPFWGTLLSDLIWNSRTRGRSRSWRDFSYWV